MSVQTKAPEEDTSLAGKMRFIHKNGRTIPIHSDHGDQQQPTAEHAAPANPPATPAPIVGHDDKPHPEPRHKTHSVSVLGYKASIKKA